MKLTELLYKLFLLFLISGLALSVVSVLLAVEWLTTVGIDLVLGAFGCFLLRKILEMFGVDKK